MLQCDPRKVKLNEPAASKPFIAKVADQGVGEIDPTPQLSSGKTIRDVQVAHLTQSIQSAKSVYATIAKEKEGASFRRARSLRAKNR